MDTVLGRTLSFQHDNASKISVEGTDEPAQSCDLNPIQHLWGELEHQV